MEDKETRKRSYGRFLSINKASTAPTMMIATNMPATAGTKLIAY